MNNQISRNLILFTLASVLNAASFFSSHAQTITVKDLTTLEAISGASVFISKNNIELPQLIGTTNNEGEFRGHMSIETEYREIISMGTLFISANGYEIFSISTTEITDNYIAYLIGSNATLSEMVISATRNANRLKDLAQPISAIQRKDIQFINPANAADLLAQTGTALIQKSQLGGGSPILRGFEANKVLYVVDGVRMNNAIYRGGHLQDILSLDPMAMENVEIAYGPSAVAYGSDALGGVMSFNTRAPRFTSGDRLVRAGAMLRYSTADQSAAHVNVETSSPRIATFTSFTFNNFGDLRQGNIRNPNYPNFGARPWYVQRINGRDSVMTNPNPNVQVGSGYRQYDFLEKLSFKQSDKLTHTLNIQYSTTNNVPRYDRLTQVTIENPRFGEWYYGPQTRAMVAYHVTLSKGKKIYNNGKITLAWQNIDQSRHDRLFNTPNLNNRVENVKVYSVNADFSKTLQEKTTANYGLEYYFNDVTSTAYSENINTGVLSPLDTRYANGGASMSGAAAYVTLLHKVNKKLALNAGIRYSRVNLSASFTDTTFFKFPFSEVNQSNGNLNGSAGLVYTPNARWRIAALVSTGFRAANVDDLSKVFESNSGNLIVPNNELKPEKVNNIEATIERKFPGKTTLALNGYYMNYTNALTTGKAQFNGQDSILYEGTLSAVYTTVNATEAYIYGGNLSLNSQVNDHFSIQSSVVYTYGRIKTDNGDTPLDHIPPVYGRTGFTFQQQKFRGEFSVLYNGWKRLEDYRLNAEDNEAYATPNGMPAWHTFNVRASYQMQEHVQIIVGIENILDANYRVFASNISGAGRNATLTLRGRF
ncbi:MAG: TonB-dependent receptor plug domain-containing protein [Flavobacteriales bacterium]